MGGDHEQDASLFGRLEMYRVRASHFEKPHTIQLKQFRKTEITAEVMKSTLVSFASL